MPLSLNNLAVEYVSLGELQPYLWNARKHPEDQVRQIARSIEEFGFNNPILVDENRGIIAGHGRLLAAQQLGIDTVPVIRLGHLTDAQARAFRIADNQITVNADWDEAQLVAELGSLREDAFDLDLLGFDEAELDRLFDGSDDDAREDEVPEPPVKPVTKPGDTWLLGKHRVRCGDSTSADDVGALLNGVEPHPQVCGVSRESLAPVRASSLGRGPMSPYSPATTAWRIFA